MKRILAALALLCAIVPAHAQKTKVQITTEVGTLFPDNATGAITPAGLRTVALDTVNSIMPTAPVVSGNLACFSGATGLLQDCGSAPTTVPLTIGTTPVNGGTTTRVLFDNAGILGEYAISGSGSVCMTSGCTASLASATGLPTTALTGTLQAAQEPAHTNDCTNSAGSLSLTCLSTNGTVFTTNATAAVGQLPGETSTGSASAGKVGEYIESVIAPGSATSLTTATAKTVTSISLTAGDWDVDCVVGFATGASASITQLSASISGTTNVLDATAGKQAILTMAAVVPTAGNFMSQAVPPYRLSLSGTTSVFLVAQSTFTAGTVSAFGIIRARRVR